MTILKYLLDHFDPDGQNNIDQMWDDIQKFADPDDYTDFANILVILKEVPIELTQKFWDHM